ncbi:MAG: metalloregulator ArsR/SmtB family transcription factor [Candidatus Bathyarchaeota archaeon]
MSEKAVERLIDSGICPAESASEHIKQLRTLSASISWKKLKEEARLFKAFSDPTRLKILKLLTHRKMCVCELNLAIDISQPTISHHLNILENARLILSERRGKWMFYSISNDTVFQVLKRFEKLNTTSRR